jgi:hypothetical protein
MQAAASRQAVTERAASRPASAAPAAIPAIFRLAAVVKICPRMCLGDSRCRTANTAVSCGPSPAPPTITAGTMSQPGATAASGGQASSATAAMLPPRASVLAKTSVSGSPRHGRRARTALAASDAAAIALISRAPPVGDPSRCAPSSGQHTISIPIPA